MHTDWGEREGFQDSCETLTGFSELDFLALEFGWRCAFKKSPALETVFCDSGHPGFLQGRVLDSGRTAEEECSEFSGTLSEEKGQFHASCKPPPRT